MIPHKRSEDWSYCFTGGLARKLAAALLLVVWLPLRAEETEGFQWKPALLQSSFFLGVQHSSRMAQAKTRR